MAILADTGINTIFIDIDDVLVDCTVDALRHLGLHNYTIDDYPDDVGRDIYEAYFRATGIRYTPAQFWELFKREWWASISCLEFCHELIDLAVSEVGQENVVLLTSPTKCGDCLAGKLDWITDNLPKWIHRQYIMTPRKYLCSFPGALLIDDAEENAEKFADPKRGGRVILYPRPWNRARGHVHNELKYIVDQLVELSREFRHDSLHAMRIT